MHGQSYRSCSDTAPGSSVPETRAGRITSGAAHLPKSPVAGPGSHIVRHRIQYYWQEIQERKGEGQLCRPFRRAKAMQLSFIKKK